jgi:hypothetical protein
MHGKNIDPIAPMGLASTYQQIRARRRVIQSVLLLEI